MSTKQIVIFTFMILFLAVMLFALGSWFHLATERDIKQKTLDTLPLREKERGNAQVKEKAAKVTEAQDKLVKALADEDLKRRDSTKVHKEHNDEISIVRYEQEEVINKVTSVTREIRTPKQVLPQGRIIQSN